MGELAELYAACMVEYATRQPDGILSGPFYTFGKEARDVFNLPYDESIFRDALRLLERVGTLRRHQRNGVQTYYYLNSKLFFEGMKETGDGKRKYEAQNTFYDGAASASASAVLSGGLFHGGKRPLTLLDAYADLGSHYLYEVLEASEKELAQVGVDDDDGGEQQQSVEESTTELVPASDRIVTLADNQRSELELDASNLIDAVNAQNQIDNKPGFRELLLGQLNAGRELIRAGSFKLFVMQVTLIETLQFLARRYEKETIGALASTLMIALCKHIGIDV